MATTVDQKLLRQTKFPPEFNRKVDMQKVNVEVMKKWIAGKISEILGSEDDIVTELCFNLLEGSRYPDIKSLQIQLTGFLDKDTAKFCKDLWNLCLSAQSNAQGVPKELLEAKKLELIQEKINADKAAEVAKQRREQDGNRERDVEAIRQRERGERADRGRGRGPPRGGKNFDSRQRQGTRSPPARRTRSPYRGHPPRRDADTWVPSGRRRHTSPPRGRSPTRSISRSPSKSPLPSPRVSLRTQRAPRRSRSRSRSLLRHRGRRNSSSASRSRSPERRRSRSRRHHSISPGDDAGKKSFRHSSSRSRSPITSQKPARRDQKNARRGRNTHPRHSRRDTSASSEASSSHSRGRTPKGNHPRARRKRSSSRSSRDSKSDQSADIVRKPHKHDDRRLSRSPDQRPRRRRSPSRSRSRSRSHSRSVYRKRRRSMQRWEPAIRRQRNTSSNSGSSPPQTKRRRDHSVDEPDQRLKDTRIPTNVDGHRDSVGSD